MSLFKIQNLKQRTAEYHFLTSSFGPLGDTVMENGMRSDYMVTKTDHSVTVKLSQSLHLNSFKSCGGFQVTSVAGSRRCIA